MILRVTTSKHRAGSNGRVTQKARVRYELGGVTRIQYPARPPQGPAPARPSYTVNNPYWVTAWTERFP